METSVGSLLPIYDKVYPELEWGIYLLEKYEDYYLINNFLKIGV
jgi:hypothetical protein